MRFRFCGDLDCPDWVLAEISTLAKISSVKLRLLCSQVLKELLGQGIDYEKVLKLTADARFVRPSIVWMASPCPVNCSNWGYLKSTQPACAAVTRRSKAPCRSTCGPAACVN
ncbi:COMM domain containing 4 [Phyllostomus discolor]|uniref:COMM domain containing 4 n=1 Tax=Phyllostomus discolor TaxID=89673 RepID=A0A834BI61_9CHIR|nr:COMM domain containing 4 [Phyllostomus discolor]